MGGSGGVVGILHPITLLLLLKVIRNGEGMQGRGVVTSGSGSGGASVSAGPQGQGQGRRRQLAVQLVVWGLGQRRWGRRR